MARLEGMLERLENENATGEGEESEHIRSIHEQYDKDLEKLHKIRVLLGRKNREIALVQRHIDEIPSRLELAQYQKRFLELFAQVTAEILGGAGNAEVADGE
jgi:hypothetical protein